MEVGATTCGFFLVAQCPCHGDDGDVSDDDDLNQGRCNHQRSLSCRLCSCHGDGRTSVQVVVMMMRGMIMMMIMMHVHLFKTPRVMAGTICQYYYTVGYLTMAGLAFLLNDSSWQVIVIGHDL